ncbi:MFS transporter [Embleya sp. NPDC050493]|uniref:MFS transporter n=1 Tax=Embleya sp. NPDC050493 TaxID=3363989 RepID=UPI0037945099
MYLSSGRPEAASEAVSARPVSGAGAVVTGNVIALGMVSLVTDVSSEMVTAVMPVYLVTGLGLTMLQFGFLDGLYSGVTVFLRLVGGHLADRFAARKRVAVAGYGMSAVAKLGLPLVGASVPGIGAVLAADRAGKGLRTAPRDALISLSSSPQAQGRAFGVHRALDTVGAFTGPLVAFAILAAVGTAYDAVFVVSFCVGLVGVAMLVLFVRDHRDPIEQRPGWRDGLRLLRDRPYRRLCAVAAVLGLVTVSDAFVYLLLQHRLEIEPHWFPLLPLGTAGVYLVLALPLGRLADRVGRRRVFLAGHGVLLAAYLLLGGPLGGVGLLISVLALHGVFYAATDGVLSAAVGARLPASGRAGGLAVVQTGQAAGRFASSMIFGALWTGWGPAGAIRILAVALAVALLGSALALAGGRMRAAGRVEEVADVR